MKDRKINVSCIQTYPKMFQKKYNLDNMKKLLIKTMEIYPDTQLVVFPELATTGYQCQEEFYNMAETADKNSFSVKIMSELAKEYNVYIIYGMAEKDSVDEKIIYNSQMFLDNKGEILGTYRKVHLFDSEKSWFTPGSEFKVFNTDIGRIGLFICYDAFFPEAARILSIQGVDLLVNSTNWEKPYDYDMDMVMAARALENTVYLACCNRIGDDTSLEFFGHTRILDSLGKVISKVDGEIEGIANATIDYKKAETMKEEYYTMLTERRPELYGELSHA